MSNTTKTRTLGIVIVLVAAAAVITGIYAATMTQSAFAAKGDPGKDKKDPADFKCTGENNGDGNTIAFICQENKAKSSGSGSVTQSATGSISIG